MRAPDAGERALVAEQRVELPALAPEDLSEAGRVQLERVRAKVAEVLLELLASRPSTPDVQSPSARH